MYFFLGWQVFYPSFSQIVTNKEPTRNKSFFILIVECFLLFSGSSFHQGGQVGGPTAQNLPDPIVVTYELYCSRPLPPPHALKIRGVRAQLWWAVKFFGFTVQKNWRFGVDLEHFEILCSKNIKKFNRLDNILHINSYRNAF